MVSVIIPAYNCRETIREAVDSALCQGVEVEVIVIDDCSSEDLSDVFAEYKDEPRVKVFKNEENLGVAKTRNRGVTLSKGEYVAFLDADDIWRPSKLEKQLALIKETGAVLCSTARELMEEDGTLTDRVINVPERITYKKLLYGNVINCSSVLIKRDVALEFPMEGDDVHEDYICWLNILKKYNFAVAINEPLLLYRKTKNSKSGSKLHSAKMTYKVYRRMGFGFIKSLIYFAGYAISGFIKYI